MKPLNTLNVIATNLRKKADAIKAGKEKRVISIFKKIGEGYGVAQDVVSVYAAVLNTAKSVMTIGEGIAKNATLRRMTAEIVGNSIQDSANRLNQVANLLDAAAKEPDIQEGVTQIGAAMAQLKETIAKVESGRRKKSRSKKRGFSVVRGGKTTQ